MKKSNNQANTLESYQQADDGLRGNGSPQSLVITLPTPVGAPRGVKKRRWQDILLTFNKMGINMDIFLIKSIPAGKGNAKLATQTPCLVINTAGLNTLASSQAFDVVNTLFPEQAGTKTSSHATRVCATYEMKVEDVIRSNIEDLRKAHRAGLTPLNRAIWYRMDEAGTVKRASIDLSKAPGAIRFRAIQEKKKSGKTRKKTKMRKSPQDSETATTQGQCRIIQI
ncbi:MAG: hypothetical protein GY809_29350, partial [Planctomycetes bacterium]|nr:hypothetical protein [Planctomycetota bacterium]